MDDSHREDDPALLEAPGAQALLRDPAHQTELQLRLPFGVPAFVAAMASLVTCYVTIIAATFLGIETFGVNPHLQAAMMSGFAFLAIYALWRDRRRHQSNLPAAVGGLAAATLVVTLYVAYDERFEILAYVGLTIAALLNWIVFLGAMNRTVRRQAREIQALNSSLERKVEHQVDQIGRLGRLKQFLAPQIADLIVAEGDENLLATHRRYIACLFCDIRGFTSVAENMEPEEVISLLQSYHDEVGRLVIGHAGTIGFRAGDGLMVFFNDPLPCEEPVAEAVRLAIEIRAAFDAIRRPWLKLDHKLGLGIGIASGYATLGLVGFHGRSDYTAIGGVVNVAARLCDRAADGEILLDQRAFCDVEPRVRTARLGARTLKGVRNKVEIHRLIGLAETP